MDNAFRMFIGNESLQGKVGGSILTSRLVFVLVSINKTTGPILVRTNAHVQY